MRVSFFNRYVFPMLFGLLNYFTIRLLHDVERLDEFWKRSPWLNGIEISTSIIVGYLGIWLYRRLMRYYDKHQHAEFSYLQVTKELLLMVFLNILILNAVFTPMVALTDDGLSWADFTDINVIPSLYTIIYYGIARSRSYLKAYIDNRLKLEKLSNDHLQTELKFLKAQYHPHFLFNALNTIYFQMDEDPAGAKHSIEQFSELLRYQLYDQRQQVPIRQELDYLQNFIELQKIRSSSRLKLIIEVDEELNAQLIYPLLLMPLVENAFKYVGGDYHIEITARLNEKRIDFEVMNSTPDFKNEATTGGIGHENLKRRLELLYPGNHTLLINPASGYYLVQLSLNYE